MPASKAGGLCEECWCLTSYSEACWFCGNTDLDYTYWARHPLTVLQQGALVSEVLSGDVDESCTPETPPGPWHVPS